MAIILKARGRLLSGFLLVAALGAVSAGAAVYSMRTLARHSARIAAETTAPLNRLMTLYATALKVESSLRDYVGNYRRAQAEKNLADRLAFVEAESEGMLGQLPEGSFRDSLETFRLVWKDYAKGIEQVRAAAEAGDEFAPTLMSGLIKGKGVALDGVMQQIVDNFIADANGLAAEAGAMARRSTVLTLLIAALGFGVSVLLGLIVARSFSRPLGLAAKTAMAIAGGDLCAVMDAKLRKRGDEVGDFARALEVMSSDLNAHMKTIRSSVLELAAVGTELDGSMERSDASLKQIAGGVETVGRQVLSQGAGIEESAATIRSMGRTVESLDGEIGAEAAALAQSSSSIEEMVGNIQSVAKGIERLGDNFERLLKASADGRTKLERSVDLIRNISSQSTKLGEANAAVSGIASKTNLLAMNAAIEAAHAGDAGRGFAVVADEIRGLAESAASQSKEIKRDIQAITSSIEEAASSAVIAKDAFGAVVGLIEGVSALEREINAALDEQREGSKQALAGLAEINEATSRVRAGSRELKEGSGAIESEMDELGRAAETLKAAASAIETSMNSVAASVDSVADLSRRNRLAIAAVETLLSRYVVDQACPDSEDIASPVEPLEFEEI